MGPGLNGNVTEEPESQGAIKLNSLITLADESITSESCKCTRLIQ